MATLKEHSQNLSSPTQTSREPAPTATIPQVLSKILRLSRPRTWTIPSISLVIGYTLAGWKPYDTLALAIGITCLVTAATNILNAYTDRREDFENQPTRVNWIETIGPKTTLSTSILLYALATSLAYHLGPLFLAVVSLGVFTGVFYSVPPLRFKTRPIVGLVSFSATAGLSFQAGLAARNTVDSFNPLFWLLTYFILTYGTVKNLPDYEGDKKAGVRTTATVFKNMKQAIRFSIALLATPYILLIGLVAVGLLPTNYLVILGLAGILVVLSRTIWRADTVQTLEQTHTTSFFYATSFLLFTLVLTNPTFESIIVVLAMSIGNLTISKFNIDSRTEKKTLTANVRPNFRSHGKAEGIWTLEAQVRTHW